MTKKERYNNLDLLRIVSCIFVVIIHVSAIWLSSINFVENNNLIVYVIVNTIAKFSVPVFFMLSGYLNISNDKNLDFKSFYRKSFYKVIIPCILFVLFYSIIKFLECIVSNDNLILVFKEILSGNLGALWFLYSLIPMYLITPFIIILKNNVDKKKFEISCIIYFVYSCFSGLFSEFSVAWTLGNSFNYLGFYLIGYILSQKYTDDKKNKPNLFLNMVLIIIFGILNSAFVYYFNYLKHYSFDFSLNFNLINVLYSILIFIFFLNLKFSKSLSFISKYTFYIYLIHPFVISVFTHIIPQNFLIDNSIVSFVLLFIIVFTISFVFSIIFDGLYKNVIKIKN